MKGNSESRKYLIWFWSLFSLPFILVIVLFILIGKEKLGPMPTFEDLENPENNLAAEVYSEDGVLLGKYYFENRTWTEYKNISPNVINALLATEDIRFYRHSGVDLRGLGRAIVRSVIMGQEAGGGSTITQQLAKNLYKTREGDSIRYSKIRQKLNLGVSKLKEWYTAVKLEKNYTKDEIITMYLNSFDFVNKAVGIKSAAQIYFNTTPDSLNIEQAAMLVGMLKNSAFFNPVKRPDQTLKRRNVVLSQMVKYGYLHSAVADSLKKLPLEMDFREEDHNLGLATYFREFLRTTMIKYQPDRRMFAFDEQYEDAKWQWDNNPVYGWCRKNKKPDGTSYNLYRDGIKIYTTINSKMQKYAEDALAEHLSKDIQPSFYRAARQLRNPPYSDDLTKKEIDEIITRTIKTTDRYKTMVKERKPDDSIMISFNTPVRMRIFSWKGERDTVMTPLDSIRYYKYIMRSSFMAEDPHTGFVKAYVGGPDFRYFKYDAVTEQKRQVGSTIKPFLYTLAMQNGYSPCYEVENIPRTFEVRMNGKDTTYTPRSSGPKAFHGKWVTLKWGLAQSENYISAWLMTQFTPQAVVDLMHRMGIRSYIDPVVSLFLGTSDITLEEMVGAYGAFANKGVYTTPVYVTRIEDRNGNVISNFTPKVEEVISEDQAYLMLNLLQGVVNEGTAIGLRYTYHFTNQIGGKTGTTQNHGNGWFMGVMPNLVAGVWSGWEDQSIHFETLGEGQGARIALPVYALFLQKLFNDPEFSNMESDVFEKPVGFSMELDCNKVKHSSSRSRGNQQRY
ncbi:MAG TPA: transglycosylase domain-containing protein [Bacteroidales bacterium]|nr:transglycosylase domain-containing protein [Bacteroidales bacterium]